MGTSYIATARLQASVQHNFFSSSDCESSVSPGREKRGTHGVEIFIQSILRISIKLLKSSNAMNPSSLLAQQ